MTVIALVSTKCGTFVTLNPKFEGWSYNFFQTCTYRPDNDDNNDDSEFVDFATTDDVVNVAVSTDGTWQKRGHQSPFVIQAAISAVTGKILDIEIQSRFCTECQAHSSWDRSTERFRL